MTQSNFLGSGCECTRERGTQTSTRRPYSGVECLPFLKHVLSSGSIYEVIASTTQWLARSLPSTSCQFCLVVRALYYTHQISSVFVIIGFVMLWWITIWTWVDNVHDAQRTWTSSAPGSFIQHNLLGCGGMQVDTKDILFICGGAFVELEKTIAERYGSLCCALLV